MPTTVPHELLAISYSAWSEKARWALDHHRVPYREREYQPLFGEPMLRLRLRRSSGRVSVPVLFAGSETYADSFDIARFAEANGEGPSLFPEGQDEAIATYNAQSEAALDSARALAVWRTAENPAALDEAVPSFIPGPLRAPVGRFGIRFMTGKYDCSHYDETGHRGRIRDSLLPVQAHLANRPYLLDDFSYADITMAVALQLVAPVADEFIRLGPNERVGVTDVALSEELAPLVAWRDGIYAKHRRVGS